MRLSSLRSILIALLLHLSVAPIHASSLKSLFDQVLEFEGQLEQSPKFRRGLESVIISFQRAAVQTADFVATSTTPGYAYSWDPATSSFQRIETSRGSVYVEPADTVGRGGIELSVAYLYSNFTKLNGDSLSDSFDQQLQKVRGTDVLDIKTTNFEFRSQVLSFAATYGITDRWDVDLLLPVFLTTLQLDGTSVLLVPGAFPLRNSFDEDGTKLGIGDILLRTKYRLPDELGFQFAAAFTLRVPSGNPDNFQGLGDVTLTPLFVVQRAVGPHLFRANLGVDVNAGRVSQSRIRYAVGATFHLVRHLSFSVDVIGSSGLANDNFTEGDVSGVVPRTDIVDAVAGFEIAFPGNVVAQIGAIVPLNHDGLRADVVPAGWVGAKF
jgi:hypothetical protein